MKRVINGSLYNSETGKKIGFWNNNISYSDFSYCEETLYKNKVGKYFIYGEGGSLSKYARQQGDTLSYGEAIIPLTRDEALEWAESHLDGDKVIKEFELPEDNRVYVGAYIDETLKKTLDTFGEANNKSLSDLIRYALEITFSNENTE